MKTIVQETAPQVALRNCSKEAGGTVNIYVILVKEYMQSSTRLSQKAPTSLMKSLLVMKSSHHHEGF